VPKNLKSYLWFSYHIISSSRSKHCHSTDQETGTAQWRWLPERWRMPPQRPWEQTHYVWGWKHIAGISFGLFWAPSFRGSDGPQIVRIASSLSQSQWYAEPCLGVTQWPFLSIY
jgi:hypothetical protein